MPPDDHELHAGAAEHPETRIRVLDRARHEPRPARGRCQGTYRVGAPLVQEKEVWLRGLVGSPDGSRAIRDEIRGPWQKARQWATWPSARQPPAPTSSLAEVYRHECQHSQVRGHPARSALMVLVVPGRPDWHRLIA